jgi:hypothetical protein
MSRAVAALLVMFSCAATAAEDEVTESPHHMYRIVQHYAGDWNASLRFRDASHPDVLLATDPDRYPWPAIYDISPDEQWIARTQKTGSGESIAFVYHVESQGRVWRMEQRLDELAFAFLSRQHVARQSYYHVGVEFVAWDLPHHVLRFRISGTAEQQGQSHLDRSLAYHLDSHAITE